MFMDELEKLYRIEELCRYMRVSRNTVRYFINTGALKAVRLSKQNIRFTRSDVEAFIESRKSESYRKTIRTRMAENE